MLFSIYMLDAANSIFLREQLAGAHKAYVARIADRLAFAGPLRDPATGKTGGSLIVAEFDDEDAARAWVAGEPHYCGGVYASVDVMHFVNRWPQHTGFPSD